MQPTFPLLRTQDPAPNFELLHRMGWSIAVCIGRYCSAWRGSNEVVFEWRDGDWHRVGGRGSAAD
jgi:hypothetical protein